MKKIEEHLEFCLGIESAMLQFVGQLRATHGIKAEQLIEVAGKSINRHADTNRCNMVYLEAAAVALERCGSALSEHTESCGSIMDALLPILRDEELPHLGIFWCCLILCMLLEKGNRQLGDRRSEVLATLLPIAPRLSAKTLLKKHALNSLKMGNINPEQEEGASCTAFLRLLRALLWKQPWDRRHSRSSHAHTTSSVLYVVRSVNRQASASTVASAPIDPLLRLLSEIPRQARSDSFGLVFEVFSCYFYNLPADEVTELFTALSTYFDDMFQKALSEARSGAEFPWEACRAAAKCMCNASLACPTIHEQLQELQTWIDIAIGAPAEDYDCDLSTCLFLIRTFLHVLFHAGRNCDADIFQRYISACANLCSTMDDFLLLGDLAAGLYYRCDRADGQGPELMEFMITHCLSPIKKKGIKHAKLALDPDEGGVWPLSHATGGDALAAVLFRVVADIKDCLVHWLGAYWLGTDQYAICRTAEEATGASPAEVLDAVDQLCRAGLSPSAASIAVCKHASLLETVGISGYLVRVCEPLLPTAPHDWEEFFRNALLEQVLKREFCDWYNKLCPAPSLEDVRQWYSVYVRQALDLERGLSKSHDDLASAVLAGSPARLPSRSAGDVIVAAVECKCEQACCCASVDHTVAAADALGRSLGPVAEGKIRLFHGCVGQKVMNVLDHGLAFNLCEHKHDLGNKGAFYFFEAFAHAAHHVANRDAYGHGEGLSGRPMVMIFELELAALLKLSHIKASGPEEAATMVFASRSTNPPNHILASLDLVRNTLEQFMRFEDSSCETVPEVEGHHLKQLLSRSMKAAKEKLTSVHWVLAPLCRNFSSKMELCNARWHTQLGSEHPELSHLDLPRQDRLASMWEGDLIGQLAVQEHEEGIDLMQKSLLAVVALLARPPP